MLPPGFADSSLTRIDAGSPSATRRRGINGVHPIAARIDSVGPLRTPSRSAVGAPSLPEFPGMAPHLPLPAPVASVPGPFLKYPFSSARGNREGLTSF